MQFLIESFQILRSAVQTTLLHPDIVVVGDGFKIKPYRHPLPAHETGPTPVTTGLPSCISQCMKASQNKSPIQDRKMASSDLDAEGLQTWPPQTWMQTDYKHGLLRLGCKRTTNMASSDLDAEGLQTWPPQKWMQKDYKHGLRDLCSDSLMLQTGGYVDKCSF